MIVEQHLILHELTLQPSAEELPVFTGWLVARVVAGLGYWLQHDVPPVQLTAGDGFIASDGTLGRLRASQLDPLKLQCFTVQPQHLDGVLTVAEWHQIEIIYSQAVTPVLFFKSADSIGQKFTRLANLSHSDRLPLRCALLQLWAAATADSLLLQDFAAENGNKLRGRFWRLFNQMTKVELCLSSPTELARQISCSERHFRGLFRKEFGVSLHTYQTQLRQQHACKLFGDAHARPVTMTAGPTDMVLAAAHPTFLPDRIQRMLWAICPTSTVPKPVTGILPEMAIRTPVLNRPKPGRAEIMANLI